MRKRILFLLSVFTLFSASAQNNISRARLSENSVVKDTAGNILPAAMWVPLYNSGKVKVQPVKAASFKPEFILSRYTEEEWTKLMESLPKPAESRAFRKSSRMSSFRAQDLQGNLYDLKELKGKVVVINFWFINCPPCRLEIPDLNELVAQYADNKEVVFLGIALDDKSRLEGFLRQMPFHYNIIENGSDLAMSNNVNAFPTHIVLNREGRIQFHTDGLAQNTVYWVKKSIDQALAQQGSTAQGK